MSPLRPRTRLATHTVTNQPPPFEEVNLFETDRAFVEAFRRAGGERHEKVVSGFGERAGSAEVIEWARAANGNLPRLISFDRFGRRIDEVEYHPAYHALMRLGIEAGIAAAAWDGRAAGHTLHAALEFLMAQTEPGVCCPMTMTYACVAALRQQPEIAAQWLPRVLTAQYDPSSQPVAAKTGVTIGMALTEKQGGSDVRANTTWAEPIGRPGSAQPYRLTGHKWFCSAPMSDAFLTLAQTANGLGCFLVPRWKPDAARNAFEIQRLKDKMGDRANASAEVEYRDTHAVMIGEDGHGVRTILQMVQHTRLDCAIAAAAYMRQALALALWHASHRAAFGKKLVDQPLMRAVLAEMAIESEAATALVFRVAASFDAGLQNGAESAFSRIATPVAKYWLNRRVVNFVYEAMEIHGGSGFVEDGPMPRLFRQSPLNSIWEGSGNVICIDVLRAMAREPQCVAALINELELARGAHATLDEAVGRVKDRLFQPIAEAESRDLVEDIALALQASLLARHAPHATFDAFCATRLSDRPHFAFGASAARSDTDAILARALVGV